MSIGTAFEQIILSIKLAYLKTKDVLFSPFRLKTYLLYGLLSWLAIGSGGGGGNPLSGFNSPNIPSNPGGKQDAIVIVAIAIGVILIALSVVILFTWLNAHAQFILMESILKNKIDIKEYWNSKRPKGNSLFWWFVKIFFIVFLLILLCAGGIAGFFIMGKSNNISGGLTCLATVLLGIVVAAILILFSIYTSIAIQIVVPSMLKMDNSIKVDEAYGILFPTIKKEWKAVIAYLFAIFMIAGAYSAFMFVIMLIAYIPLSIFAVAIATILAKTPALMITFIIIALLAGVILTIFILSAIYPVLGVFLTTFKLNFVGKILPEYETITPILNEKKQVTGYRTMYDIVDEPNEYSEEITEFIDEQDKDDFNQEA